MPSFWRSVKGEVVINEVEDDQEEMMEATPSSIRWSFKNKKKKETKEEANTSETSTKKKDKKGYKSNETSDAGHDKSPLLAEPNTCDNILWNRWMRLLYVLLLCLLLGLIIPYILSGVVFQRHKVPFPHRGLCQIVTSYRFPCLPGVNHVEKSACLSASCCYDTRRPGDMLAPICYHSMPSDHGYAVSKLLSYNASTFTSSHLGEGESRPEGHVKLPKNSFIPPTRIWRLQDSSSLRLNLISLRSETPWGNATVPLHLLVDCEKTEIIRIKLWSAVDENHDEKGGQTSGQEDGECLLEVVILEQPGSNFNITIKRLNATEDGKDEVIFNTVFGPMIYSKDYWEITTVLPTRYFYGMGPRHSLFLSPDFDAREQWAIHNTQDPAQKDRQSSAHPFYMCFEETGNIHGVLLKSTSPLDVSVIPAPALILRGFRGPIELFVMAGPTPHEVSRQYSTVVGFPALPPFWALGYHLCRSSGNLTSFRKVEEGMNDSGIPYESDCVDALLWKKDSFGSPQREQDLEEIIGSLQEKNRKFLMVSYPTIPKSSSFFQDVEQQDLLLKVNESETLYGTINGTTVAFPDYTNEEIMNYLNVSFADGLILQDNTPLNEAYIMGRYNDTERDCNKKPETCCKEEYLPFHPMGIHSLSNGTACMWSNDTSSPPKEHLNHHNEYGHQHARRMQELLQLKFPEERTFVISQSTSTGSGAYVGQFGGDFPATYLSARRGLVNMLQLSLSGVPLVSDPICGNKNSTTNTSLPMEICVRGVQTAAFYPFMISYNHPGHLPRNPPDIGDNFLRVIRPYIMQRYMMIPYVYKLFHEANTKGTPVVRPLFYEFPNDTNSRNVSTQFMLGPSLLVSPVFQYTTTDLDGKVDVKTYFPPGCWYSMYSGNLISNSTKGEVIEIPTLLADSNVHLRGGHIIALQGNLHDEDILTTVELRQKNFTLLVAFDCISPTNSSASNSSDDSNRASVVNNSETSNTSRVLATGNIIIDDGVSLNSDINSTWQFEATEYSLTINRTDDNNFCDEVTSLNISSTVEKLWVFGVPPDTEVSVTLDGSLQDGSTHMNNLALDLCLSSSYSIEWK